MAKVFVYTIFIFIMMALFTFAGVGTTTGSQILSATGIVDSPQNFQNSNAWTLIISILAVGIGASIIIGSFTRVSPESFIIGAFSAVCFAFILDVLSVITYMNSVYPSGSEFHWLAVGVNVILGALVAGYIIVIVSYWRGTD